MVRARGGCQPQFFREAFRANCISDVGLFFQILDFCIYGSFQGTPVSIEKRTRQGWQVYIEEA